jgi:DNA-binding MarR family transcriptional regulator
MDKEQIHDLIDRYVKVSFSVTKKAEALLKEQMGDDLTHDQHYMLRYIKSSGQCTSSELAEAFEVNKSAITAIITRLTEKGFIQRTRDQNDRRVVYLTLTEKGLNLFNQTEDKVHCLVESFIKQFDDKEIQEFIQTYEKLEKVMISIKEKNQEEKNAGDY